MKISTENLTKVIKKIGEAADKGVFSPFKIVGSAGIDAGVEVGKSGLSAGGTTQKFEILNLKTNEKRWLGFVGAGAGYGVGGTPIGGSFSTADFPSTGGRIAMGFRQWTTNFDWADLEGNTFIYTASVGAGGVQSASLIMFNYAVSEYYCYGIGVLQGKAIGSPGVGVMNFIGITKYI
ncbi:MAG TPA: hypothetical protein PKY82_32005 [Pyrinomonadaceae bacterium]|nr:hypothetical protein [Pyrinomonadaceae bacterium]